jgi:two-component system, NtrC family, response regulator AtoC
MSAMTPQFQQQINILIVEDEVLFARAVLKHIKQTGFNCEHVESIEAAVSLLKQYQPDLVLLDMRLPDGNGMDLLSILVEKSIATIVMTAFGEVADAVTAMKMGAIDFLKKPIDLNELLLVIQKNLNVTKIEKKLSFAKQRNEHAKNQVKFIGDCYPIQNVRQRLQRIAQLNAIAGESPPAVLITGETGSGKDVAARFLHELCFQNHSDKPFVHVDCASLPAALIESELFGYEKGAFTNALSPKPGLIEAAEDGVLFLDEIGELPLELQAKLLNVLERRVVRRLGSSKEHHVVAMFVAATNQNLEKMVANGQFRADLFYRLNVIAVEMPPLRNRVEDILTLAYYFKEQAERKYKLKEKNFSKEALKLIQDYQWPGNVREMNHLIGRAVILSDEGEITPNAIGINTQFGGANLPDVVLEALTLEESERKMIVSALTLNRNNVSKAARALGITRMTMRYRMNKYDISA